MMKPSAFWITAIAVLVLGAAATEYVGNAYYFFAAYMVLQYIIMGTAWNILGGFTGYVNFGSAGFFAMGAYTSIALQELLGGAPMIVYLVASAVICGLIGLGTGYLTLRLRGVYFAIATLALAIVLETLITNWEYVGGARGYYVVNLPAEAELFGSPPAYLFLVILILAVGSVAVARYINSSKVGRGLAAIRDDELAAECMGVPTLRLKLLSTTVMGALMGVAGAPYPFYVSYVDPLSAFNLLIAVNSIAMPMIGGTASWLGPVIGGLLLGSAQEYLKVTQWSEYSPLIVGVILVGFVTLAPQGIVGLVRAATRKKG